MPCHFSFTIICVFRQEIKKLPHDVDKFGMRKTSWRVECARFHDRCEKVQNRMRGHNFSSGSPSSTRNVDGVGPTNISGDIPGKKSELDLRPFGVGVPAADHMVMP